MLYEGEMMKKREYYQGPARKSGKFKKKPTIVGIRSSKSYERPYVTRFKLTPNQWKALTKKR